MHLMLQASSGIAAAPPVMSYCFVRHISGADHLQQPTQACDGQLLECFICWAKLAYQCSGTERDRCLQDSWSDLQLFLALNVAVISVGVAVKYLVVDVLDGQSATHDFWQSLYQVMHGRLSISHSYGLGLAWVWPCSGMVWQGRA